MAELISGFIDGYRRAVVILLDALDYLFVNNGYHQTLMFVERVKERVVQRKAIILVPVPPDTLKERELAQLMRRFPIPFSDVLRLPIGKDRREFVRSVAPGVLLIPMKRGLTDECKRLRDLLPMPVEIERAGGSVEDRIHAARRSRVLIIVLVAGGEVRSRTVHVILRTGEETWMSLEAVERAFRRLLLHS